MSNSKFRKKTKNKNVNQNKTSKPVDKNKLKTQVPDHFLGHFNQLIQASNVASIQLNAAQINVDKVRSDIEAYFYKICAKMHLDPDLVMIEQEKETGILYIVSKKDVNLEGAEKINDPNKELSNDSKESKVNLKTDTKEKDKENQSNITSIKARELANNANDKPKRAYKKKTKVDLEENNSNPEVNPDIVN